MAKTLNEYCCPKCGSDSLYQFDCKDAEIDLENNRIYTRQALTCEDCGEEFTMVTTGDIINLNYSAY